MKILSRLKTIFGLNRTGSGTAAASATPATRTVNTLDIAAQKKAPARRYGIQAAARNNGMEKWAGLREDYAAQEYVQAIYDVMARGYDLHFNCADIRGHHQGRTARNIGKGVVWRVELRPEEVGLSPEQALATAELLNRLRELHSQSGGMDAQGKGRSEGILQIIAFLTHMVCGGCLIHRVWRPSSSRALPLALELIPGSRISTPYKEMGNPLISFGVEYADEYRSQVVGYHVKRVPQSIGNSFINLPEWDFIPIEDAAFLELLEPAGIDRSLPDIVAITRLVFNRGELIERTVECARAHSNIHAVVEAAAGQNPYDNASDAADGADPSDCGFQPEGWTMVDGVKMFYTFNGEKVTFNNATMPQPDFKGFNEICDSRLTRGLNTRQSELTRKVDTSYSGGMQERQIDNPNVEQMRENFVCQWNKVHAWFLDACFIAAGSVAMPGYSSATALFWNQARKQFPGEVPLNPVDHRNAQKLALAMGLTSEIQECEADGDDYEKVQREKAKAWAIRRKVEAEFKLPPNTLEPLADLPEVKTEIADDADGDKLDKAQPDSKFTATRTGNRISGRMKAVRV